MEVDPDYSYDISQESIENEDRKLLLENTSREAVKEKIKSIISKQFSEEIAAKEREVTLITERLAEARHLLDRLRACVVASYYASSFAKPQEKHSVEPGAAHHPAIQNVLRKAATAILSRNAPVERKPLEIVENSNDRAAEIESLASKETESKEIEGISKMNESELDDSNLDKPLPDFSKSAPIQENLGGRHRIKKTIIVGNVSKYIAPDKREMNDKSSHKWMVYVRGSADEPRIDHFVRKVWFFLHPSYRPNDLVEVSEAPFHLTRRGWGEFPIRVQLHFCDPRNRRVDIIHNLRLDRTYTGLQTLGAETVCEVELDRSTIGLPVENLLCQPVDPPHVEPSAKEESEENLEQESDTNEKSPKDENLENEVNEVILDMLKKIEDESCQDEKMDVDPEEVEEHNLSSPATEKKRRRRRGDSSCVVEKEEQKPKSMTMMLLCPDEEVDVVNVDEKRSNDFSPQSNENSIAEYTEKFKDGTDAVLILDNTDDNSEKDVEDDPDSPSVEKEVSDTTSLVPTTTCVNSPSQTPPPPATVLTQTVFERPRSLSADSTPSSVSVSLKGGKLLCVRKVAPVKKGPNIGNLPESVSSPVVVLRSRASSTGLLPQKFTQTTKGKVTILTPIGAKAAKSPNIVAGQKRSFSQNLASPGGKIMLNVLPDKKLKQSPNLTATKPSVLRTRSTGPIKLSVCRDKSSGVPVLEAARSMPGTLATSSSNAKLENDSKKGASKPKKSFILKNTKQGLIVVRQNIVVKDSTIQTTPKQTVLIQAKNTATSELKTTKEATSSYKPVVEQSTVQKTPSVDRDQDQELNERQLLALKALKSALASSGVATNKPVQIKIEKAGGQSWNQLKNNQQFVLTTITNDQGKQQLALVSADRMKQVMENKRMNKSVGKAGDLPDDSPLVIKLESDQASWPLSKANDQENRPYHEVIGGKISSSTNLENVKDFLPIVVKYVPLITKDENLTHLPFCAKSEAEFLEWNIGKQRAAEMKRALLIQRTLKYICQNSPSLSDSDIPSKRYIMKWCLLRGYSVFTDEYEESANTDVRSDAECSFVVKPSLSDHCDLINDLNEEEATISNERNEDSSDIDIISVSSPKISVKTERVDESSEYSSCRFIHTDKTSCVEKMVQEIGLTLKEVPISEKAKGPVTQIVLGKALELFVQQLTRESLASALLRRDGDDWIQRVQPEELQCADVVSAIQRNDNLHILSDNSMGLSHPDSVGKT